MLRSRANVRFRGKMIVDTKKLEKRPEGFRNSADVAGGCQYIRWMANGRKEVGPALMVIAIGTNSIAISRDAKLDPEDALELLQVEADTIATLLRELGAGKECNGFLARPNR